MYCELTRLCSLADISRFAPEFWWQLVRGRALRYCSIFVKSLALLPDDFFRHVSTSCAKFVLWLQTPLIVLEFSTLLLVLHIQHVDLVSGLCRFSAVFSPFTKLSDHHTCCNTPGYKYWMPTLVKEITLFRN